MVTKSKNKALTAIDIIGGSISAEIIRLAESRREGLSRIREICLRAEGRSSVLFGDERVTLLSDFCESDMEGLLERMCDGAIYAYRDSISKGYITLSGGIRVGIGGHAKYEHRSLVGVSDIRSLILLHFIITISWSRVLRGEASGCRRYSAFCRRQMILQMSCGRIWSWSISSPKTRRS